MSAQVRAALIFGQQLFGSKYKVAAGRVGIARLVKGHGHFVAKQYLVTIWVEFAEPFRVRHRQVTGKLASCF